MFYISDETMVIMTRKIVTVITMVILSVMIIAMIMIMLIMMMITIFQPVAFVVLLSFAEGADII